MEKMEGLLRFVALCVLGLAAVLMASDNQTIMFLGVIAKKATFHCSKIYVMSVYFYAIGAGYNLAQLARCLSSLNKASHDVHNFTWSTQFLKWVYFIADQMAAYMIFVTTLAALQFSFFAITGMEEFQWMKLCDKYRKFCFQIGGSVVCGILGSLLLALISAISAFNLFRWYSPNFLCIKPKRVNVVPNLN